MTDAGRDVPGETRRDPRPARAGEAAAGATGPSPTGSTGSTSPGDTELAPGEEPVVTGALFLSMVLLMLIAGAWVVMFITMIGR